MSVPEIATEDVMIRFGFGWSLNEEEFFGGDCESREAAVSEATARWEEENEIDGDDAITAFTVWTCVAKPYEPDWESAIEYALENLEESVGESMGDASGNWRPSKNRGLIANLQPGFAAIVTSHEPCSFWTVEAIQSHEITREPRKAE